MINYPMTRSDQKQSTLRRLLKSYVGYFSVKVVNKQSRFFKRSQTFLLRYFGLMLNNMATTDERAIYTKLEAVKEVR